MVTLVTGHLFSESHAALGLQGVELVTSCFRSWSPFCVIGLDITDNNPVHSPKHELHCSSTKGKLDAYCYNVTFWRG